MAYFQTGILIVVGLLIFGIFMGFFIDLNKDASFHNRRQRHLKPRLSVIRTKKKSQVAKQRPNQPVKQGKAQPMKQQQKKERSGNGKPERGPRGPEKRR